MLVHNHSETAPQNLVGGYLMLFVELSGPSLFQLGPKIHPAWALNPCAIRRDISHGELWLLGSCHCPGAVEGPSKHGMFSPVS